VPDFEKQTGHKVTVDNGTAGELKKRIEGGEVFDVAVITPDVVDDLIAKGKIAAGSRARQRRRRRGGEGGRAQAGREHGRGFQACAAGGEVGCLYRSGEWRLQRHLYRQIAGPAWHRRSDPAEGEAQEGRPRRRSDRQRRRQQS
jgi:hypothetical protein